MTNGSDYEPDPDVIEERRPASCPFCGYEGAFDGQGRRIDKTTISGQVFRETWYQARCAECNGAFRMREGVTRL